MMPNSVGIILSLSIVLTSAGKSTENERLSGRLYSVNSCLNVSLNVIFIVLTALNSY